MRRKILYACDSAVSEHSAIERRSRGLLISEQASRQGWKGRRARMSAGTADTVVCVTGGSGYIGSWLVRKLLGRGCVVHATLRSLADEKKTELLRALPGAAERLRLFEADMYDADTFEPAIAGCHFVFLVATPMAHDPTSTKYKNMTEATVDAVRIILRQCERSGTVKRVIYTASVTAASPLKEDGSGYKDFTNESNWTPLNLSYEFSNTHLDDYVRSKLLSEKELLSYNESSKDQPRTLVEVVALACAVVGGDTIQTYLWSSLAVVVAPLTGQAILHNSLMFIQALMGSVPLAHVEDVCEAHVFCMEQASMSGRFLCAAGYPNMRDIVDHFAAKHPDLEIKLTEVTGEGIRIVPNTSKLEDLGFRFKYGVEETLDCSVECAKRLGEL
ncbi:putative anthocyanidin reductase [Sorghum bicolor]|nr:putative anthocyanidin reductase [Sorghum bicolor]|eukprot:XP_002463149.2 putative anthocyanidin reductase [Sorghum bicolor]